MKKILDYIWPGLLIIFSGLFFINTFPALWDDPYSPHPDISSLIIFLGTPCILIFISLKSIFTKEEKKYKKLNKLIIAILIVALLIIWQMIRFKNAW